MKGAGQIEARVSEDTIAHGSIKQDPALTASNISPGAASERRSCLGFSLRNPQSVFFTAGSDFVNGFIINALMVTNGCGTGSFVLLSN